MVVQPASRCDLCGKSLPRVAENWITQDNHKYEWIIVGNDKYLCKKCVLDVINELHCLGLTDWFNQEDANVLGPNDLCPLGWAWLIGDCDCVPDSGNCDDCDRDLAPITKEAKSDEA